MTTTKTRGEAHKPSTTKAVKGTEPKTLRGAINRAMKQAEATKKALK